MYATCVRNTNQEGQLTIGKRYKIIQRGKLGDAIYIKSDNGRMWWINIKRFEIKKKKKKKNKIFGCQRLTNRIY